jgi:uncharacterized protein YndB with AHSA1/START domain
MVMESAMTETTMSETAELRIEKRLEFDAPVEKVWRAITEPDELAQWFGHRAELDLRPGGAGAMTWEEHGRFAVRVEAVEPPTRLVWSWVHEPDVDFEDAPATRVEWLLTEREGGGTTLRLVETGFRTELHHKQNTGGWDEELAELVTLLAS